MDKLETELLEEFKRVDAICKDILSSEKGVNTYIELMDQTPISIRMRIPDWDNTYRSLKRVRWIRNQIAHEPICEDCKFEDLKWLESFHERLINQTDALACADKMQNTQTNKIKTVKKMPQSDNKGVSKGENSIKSRFVIFAVIFAFVFAAAVAGAAIYLINMFYHFF